MGFFKKIFGKQIDLGEQMPIYFVSSDEDYMQRAFEQARESFRYFWRELYWERRRIVPGLDYAMVKICFLDTINGEELAEHDAAWGLDFGDFNDILVVYEQKEHPENLIEHPMSKNMTEQFENYAKEHPSVATDADEFGYTQLHHEAIAGNLNLVNLLLKYGADKNARTKSGKTAAEFAEDLGWEHIAKVLR